MEADTTILTQSSINGCQTHRQRNQFGTLEKKLLVSSSLSLSIVQPQCVTLTAVLAAGMSSPRVMASTGSQAPLARFLHTSTATHLLWTTPPTPLKVRDQTQHLHSTSRWGRKSKCEELIRFQCVLSVW